MLIENTITMKRSNLFIILFITILVAIGVIGFAKVNKTNAQITKGSDNYTISDTWELPVELNEVSGIVWIDNHTLACVQDEVGMIYIYDLNDKAVVDEIPFAGNGDYEGIALHKDDLYVMQSDGLLYEVKNWKAINKTVSTHETGFNSANNMESLTYSIADNCLLTVPKDKDDKNDYKGIYKINLHTKQVDIETPAYKINMYAPDLREYRHKKIYKTFNPSEIAEHPITKELYVLEGKHPKLLVLNPQGDIKNVYKLDEINFPQPEGMTFSDDGDLYISNESATGPATIHLIEFKNAS